MLIGSVHKRATDDELAALQASGLTDVRLHLSKLRPERVSALASEAERLGMGIYLDTRGNKPTITKLTLGGKTVDKVSIQAGDHLYFCTEPPHDSNKYKATFAMSYLPAVLRGTKGKHIAIDDGNIILKIDDIRHNAGQVTGLSAIVQSIDFAKVDAIYHEGLSSFDVPIHSYADTLLTSYDRECMAKIDEVTKKTADNFVVSFAEYATQIRAAHQEIRAAGFTKARIVPKLETVAGIEHAKEIADTLEKLYGEDAQLWIGRGDLTVALLQEGAQAVIAAEERVLALLKEQKTKVIVATNVANSLRYYQPGQQLSADEKAGIKAELSHGAAGFVLAAELYAGPNQQGEYAVDAVKLVADVIAELSGHDH